MNIIESRQQVGGLFFHITIIYAQIYHKHLSGSKYNKYVEYEVYCLAYSHLAVAQPRFIA